MGDEDARLALEHAGVADDVLEDVLAHVRVHGRQRVVQQEHVRVAVARPVCGQKEA